VANQKAAICSAFAVANLGFNTLQQHHVFRLVRHWGQCLPPRRLRPAPEQIQETRDYIAKAAPAPGINGNRRGHTSAQGGFPRMGFKADAHRQALHHLHPIA